MQERLADYYLTIAGFVATFIAGIVGYGKLLNKVENHDKMIAEIRALFIDSENNPRLMTIIDHEKLCSINGRLIFGRLDHIVEKQEESIERDAELFSRVRKIEDCTLKMSVALEDLKGKE